MIASTCMFSLWLNDTQHKKTFNVFSSASTDSWGHHSNLSQPAGSPRVVVRVKTFVQRLSVKSGVFRRAKQGARRADGWVAASCCCTEYDSLINWRGPSSDPYLLNGGSPFSNQSCGDGNPYRNWKFKLFLRPQQVRIWVNDLCDPVMTRVQCTVHQNERFWSGSSMLPVGSIWLSFECKDWNLLHDMLCEQWPVHSLVNDIRMMLYFQNVLSLDIDEAWWNYSW